MAQTALFINIQRFSLHDGPGIRTTFFFKGCPLHCLWCHNPESQSFQPQVMHYTERCTGCRSCIRVCAEQAIYCENGIAETDSTKCIRCGECTDFCPNNAREISGNTVRTIRRRGNSFRRRGYVAADRFFGRFFAPAEGQGL